VRGSVAISKPSQRQQQQQVLPVLCCLFLVCCSAKSSLVCAGVQPAAFLAVDVVLYGQVGLLQAVRLGSLADTPASPQLLCGTPGTSRISLILFHCYFASYLRLKSLITG
jgi:hypothetical protein